MSDKKDNRALKALTVGLALSLIVLGFFTFKFYTEERNNDAILENEKIALENNLKEYLVNYNEAIKENAENKQYLQEAQYRIQILLDSIQKMDMDLPTLARLRREITGLQKEKEQLFKMVDSLNKRNLLLAGIIDSTTTVLSQQNMVRDSLTNQNRELETRVAIGSQMNVAGLRAEAVKIRNNGKIISTERSRRANNIKTCFTITKNPLIEQGEKEFFIQVIDPKNNLLGEPQSIEFGEDILNYSTIQKVYYENENLDVCVMVENDDLEKGTYIVNIFYESELLATDRFILK